MYTFLTCINRPRRTVPDRPKRVVPRYPSGNLLNEEIHPARPMRGGGKYYFLAKSNKRLSDTLVYSPERWNSWPMRIARGNEERRDGDARKGASGNKRTRETIPILVARAFGGRKSVPDWGWNGWQVRPSPFLESGECTGTLNTVFHRS